MKIMMQYTLIFALLVCPMGIQPMASLLGGNGNHSATSLQANYYMGKVIAQGAVDGVCAQVSKIDFSGQAQQGVERFINGLADGSTNALNGQKVSNFIRASNGFFNKTVISNMAKVSSILLAYYATSYCLEAGIPFAFKMLERYMTRPQLIIESSKKPWYGVFVNNARQIDKPMVFEPGLEKTLKDIVQTTTTIHKKIKEGKTNIKYRNLMLYGPPGTGKTMFATELAKRSGLEYAFMSGSSFSKFKDGEGIEALDHLFAWAKRSKGLLIFIDEAETFLMSRDKLDPQSKAYLLLNNFLNYTGERSDRFMLVFATNKKDALDSAMYRRIDDLIEIPLPGKAERARILKTYKESILLDKKQNDQAFIDSVCQVLNDQVIDKIAQDTKGLSGGELQGIIYGIKTSTDILEPAIVTEQLVNTVVKQAVLKHQTFTGGKPLGVVLN